MAEADLPATNWEFSHYPGSGCQAVSSGGPRAPSHFRPASSHYSLRFGNLLQRLTELGKALCLGLQFYYSKKDTNEETQSLRPGSVPNAELPRAKKGCATLAPAWMPFINREARGASESRAFIEASLSGQD